MQVAVWPGAVIGPAVDSVRKAVAANFDGDMDDATLTPENVTYVSGTAKVHSFGRCESQP